MRGRSILILLVLILPTLQPGPSFTSLNEAVALSGSVGEALAPGLVLSEVCPGRPVEYVIISNWGSDSRLHEVVISDGEGNITILANLTLSSGCSIGIAVNASMFHAFHPGMECLEKGSPSLLWGGRFTLADAGDCVTLVIDHQVVDVLPYGSSQYSGEGWIGAPVGPVPKAHAVVRTGGDQNSAEDWCVEPPGRSDLQPETFEAIVEPFSAPENAAGRLIRELALATREVKCAIYELSDPEMVNALARCSRRGVEVYVLIEGQPVGGLSNASLMAISTLQASGVDVRLLRSMDSYKRYDYLHAKYMVVDGRRVVVMSENWGNGLTRNRGWGVCMDGPEVGNYFARMFLQDFRGPMDIVIPSVTMPSLEQVDIPTPSVDDLVRYRCKVTPIISPDFSESTLHSSLIRAENKILVEQLSVEKDWLSDQSLVSDLISAASRGVQVRVLLDSSWGGGDNREVVEKLNALAATNGMDLEARMITDLHGLTVMHNKGVIVDDQVVVSSINWGDGALYENREAGVLISCAEVTSFFENLFWSDWSVDSIPPSAALPWSYLSVEEGEAVFLDGTLCNDNSRSLTYEWDVDADGLVDNRSRTWAAKLGPGNHTIILTACDPGNHTASVICWVEVLPSKSGSFQIPSVIFLLPVVVVAVALMLKRIIGRKRH